MRNRGSSLVCLVVAAAIAGCGGTSSADQVRTAYTAALAALGHGDYRTFCGLLSNAYRARIAQSRGNADSSVTSCAALLAHVATSTSTSPVQLRAAVGNQHVIDVRINAGRAQITVSRRLGGITVTGEATAVLEGGVWRIDSFPATSNVGHDRLYRVPSGSMAPTLPAGTRVLVDPASYRSQAPAVGEIILFHPPAGADQPTPACGNPQQGAGHAAACATPTSGASSQTFIKRIVAGPGDTLQIRGGRVIRNGQQEAEPYVAACGSDPLCNFPATIKIPPGDYFVLGDNRGQSDDSRFWGPVPRTWIIGKVVRRVS